MITNCCERCSYKLKCKSYSQSRSEMSPQMDVGKTLSTGSQVSKQHPSSDACSVCPNRFNKISCEDCRH